jgi:hypothetical protein
VHIPEHQVPIAAGIAGFGIGTLAVVAGNAFVDMIVERVLGWISGVLDKDEERYCLDLERKLVLVRLLSELFRFRLGRLF